MPVYASVTNQRYDVIISFFILSFHLLFYLFSLVSITRRVDLKGLYVDFISFYLWPFTSILVCEGHCYAWHVNVQVLFFPLLASARSDVNYQ